MKRLIPAFGAVVVALAVPALVAAQSHDRTPPAGSSSAGQATPRGGSSSGPPPSSSSSGGAVSRPSGGSGSSGGGSGFSGNAVSRPSPGSTNSRARGRDSASVGQPVPSGERARGDRPYYGQAVPRPAQTPGTVPAGSAHYDYYSPFLYYGYGAFGLGYWTYPWGWGSPYGFGYGYDNYGYGGGYGGAYGGGYGGAYYAERNYGSVKLKVKPNDAEVYVDGYYMGLVNQFDGMFQHMSLEAGTHQVEIRANGYEPLTFELRVLPNRSLTYEGTLTPGKSGPGR